MISPRAGWLAVLFLFLGTLSDTRFAHGAVPDVVLIDDFESGIPNALDGYHGAFQSGSSKIDLLRDTTFFHGEGKRGTSLRIRANKQDDGFCGVWLQCFDSKAAKKKFFDSPGECLARRVMTSIVNRSLKNARSRSFVWAQMHLVTSERSIE